MYGILKIWNGLKLAFLLLISGIAITYMLEHNSHTKSTRLADPLTHVQLRIPDPAGSVQPEISGSVEFGDRARNAGSSLQGSPAVPDPQRKGPVRLSPRAYALSDLGLQIKW